MIQALLIALLGGLVLPLQAGLNAELRQGLGNPLLATLVSFLAGTISLVPVLLAVGVSLPPSGTLATINWWKWAGGALGAVYVLSTIVSAPRLGAATMIATVVAGQMIASLLLDHYGLAGFSHHPVNLWRVAGALLILGGVVLIQRN
jgi:transporter family-2 protein